MRLRLSFALVTLGVLMLSNSVRGQQAPSALDARAAYCIPVVKNEIAWKSELLQDWSSSGRGDGGIAQLTEKVFDASA